MPIALWLSAVVWVLGSFSLTAQEIVITFGGDVNFARSRQAPSADGSRKNGFYSYERLTETIGAEWDGDINFVNVETVVAEKDGSPQWGKGFVFRSHSEWVAPPDGSWGQCLCIGQQPCL